MRARFQRVERDEVVRVVGPEPVGQAMADRLAVVNGLNMAGHNGSLRWGEKSSPAVRFAGDLSSPQAFIGAGSYGSKQGPIASGLSGVLPNTSTPPGLPGSLQSMFPTRPA